MKKKKKWLGNEDYYYFFFAECDFAYSRNTRLDIAHAYTGGLHNTSDPRMGATTYFFPVDLMLATGINVCVFVCRVYLYPRLMLTSIL